MSPEQPLPVVPRFPKSFWIWGFIGLLNTYLHNSFFRDYARPSDILPSLVINIIVYVIIYALLKISLKLSTGISITIAIIISFIIASLLAGGGPASF